MTPLFRSLIKMAFFVTLAILGCSKKEKPLPKVDPAFATYVSAFTSGMVSKESTIKVRLVESTPTVKIGEPINETLFKFSPRLEGTAVWLDAQTIEFRPNTKLESGTQYKAEFALSKLRTVPEKLETLEFYFRVFEQSMVVEFAGVESYKPEKLEWQMIHGVATTFDFANGQEVEEAVTATQNGEKLTLRWVHKKDGKVHTFSIDSVLRHNIAGTVEIKWNGKPLGFKGKGGKTIQVPALNQFVILDHSLSQENEQVVSVYFSDPLSPEQDIDGFVSLEDPSTDIRIIKEKNTIKIYPQQRLNKPTPLKINPGIENSLNQTLKQGYEQTIPFSDIKPALEIMGKGIIVPGTDGLHFPFRAVNLHSVEIKITKIFESNIPQFLQINQLSGDYELNRVGRIVYKGTLPLKSNKPINFHEWNAFSIDLGELTKTELGAIYRVQLSMKKKNSAYPCPEEIGTSNEKEFHEQEQDEDELYDAPNHNWNYYGYYDDYYYQNYKYQEASDPCKPSYYMEGGRSVAKNLFSSNLGIIAKNGLSNQLVVAVTNILTTEPLPKTSIDIYNFQNKLTGSATTDKNGLAKIDLTKKPFLLIAKQGKSTGYLRLDDGNSLSLSMFDIGGQELQKGVKAFIYGERGVWRPGDSIYITTILDDKNNILPPNHPVIFEFYTPQQQLFERKVRSTSVNRFYDFRTATPKDAPTGNWHVKVKVGGSTFIKPIKIEAIKPNRLKINLNFNAPQLSERLSPKGDLQIKWLHGSPGSNLRATAELTLSKSRTSFKQYIDYDFDDPSKDFKFEEKIIFDGLVDDNGKTTIHPKLTLGNSAPGKLQAVFKLRAFEKSGDFSIDRVSIPYSPYTGYVGVKVPEGKGWNGALYSDETIRIPIVTVNEVGNPVDRSEVLVEVFNVYWRWWWDANSDNDLSQYVGSNSHNLIKSAKIHTIKGKAMYQLNFDGNQYGRKFIRVTDLKTGHSTGKAFYVTYNGWSNENSNNPGGAEMLVFSTNKQTYVSGEKISVSLPSAKKGRILASIESGSKVLETFWVSLSESKKSFEFVATPEMAPNVYIHLSMIQPFKNVGNDLPIRLFGVQSINVESPSTHLNPVISMPTELAPEKSFSVSVSESAGKKMTYTLAVVDEGLLDLTSFKTPDPWSTFFAKEALSVRTWDMYAYVLGAYSGEMAGLLALGGDESISKKGAATANRFVPVVKFIGPFVLDSKKKNTHKLDMPNYVGSVRTMVIAGDKSAYGSAEKTTPVKKPLMVLATMPRVLGPGELVNLPVTVFAMDKKIKDVSVTVEYNNHLILEAPQTKHLKFNREGDQVVSFSFKVAEKLGIAKLKVIAKSGNHQAHDVIELDVRSPNPVVYRITDALIDPGKTGEFDYKAFGITGTNKATLEVSSTPPIKLENRLQYLISYPHGCIEQTTSGVFPQLYLKNLVELNQEKTNAIDHNIKAGIQKLKTFQLSSGGLSYWPGERDAASEWGTNYAGHFMLEAKAQGYTLPVGFLANWIKFQTQRANSWVPTGNDHYSIFSDQLVQAYRLYTLALAGEPLFGAMNRLKALENLGLAAKWRLAATYLLAGKKEIASSMVNDAKWHVDPYQELSYSYGSDTRDEAMILETLHLLGRKKEAYTLLTEIALELASDQWYSTQTTAYALMAISKFVNPPKAGEPGLMYSLAQNGKAPKQITKKSPMSQQDLGFPNRDHNRVIVKNTGNKVLFAKLMLEGIPSTSEQMASQNQLTMSVQYRKLDGSKIDPEVIQQGTDFFADVEVTHPGIQNHYQELALTQIFPSGWEIRNMRLEETTSENSPDLIDYQNIRDDRVLTYFGLNKGKTKKIKILLNAAYTGTFYLPMVSCEAMYNNQIHASIPGKWVKVVASGSSAP